jgi:hypothetical protein
MRKILLSAFFLIMLPAAHAELSVSTFSLNFFNVPVNGGYQTQSVWVQNTDTEVLNLEITNSCYDGFQVSSFDCDRALQPNSFCTINVQFQPRHTGFVSCNINIYDNAGDFDTVSVSGSGI